MPDQKCGSVSTVMSAIYDRNVHTVASHGPLKMNIPLGTCAADERSELNPVDMMAMGLASCLLIVMGKKAVAENLDIVGAKADVSYRLEDYRIKAFKVDIQLPKKIGVQDQVKLTKASEECPLFLALNSDVDVTVNFKWPQ